MRLITGKISHFHVFFEKSDFPRQDYTHECWSWQGMTPTRFFYAY